MNEVKKKTLKELNLLDDFLFSVAVKDLEICKSMLEIILDKKIVSIRYNQSQMEFKTSPKFKGVRLDVVIEDEEGVLYNIEVQMQNTGNLSKRSRFYQSLMDFPLLESGDKNYNHLNPTYIIMITPFDLFGKGRYRYTFKNICVEDSDVHLEDGTAKIFLNTKGTNHNEVSDSLIDFLKYVENTTDECASQISDVKIQELHEKIERIKNSREIGVAYMQMWERELMWKAEAKAESLLEVLASYGNVSDTLREEIMAEKDYAVLKHWFQLAIKAANVQEFIENKTQI